MNSCILLTALALACVVSQASCHLHHRVCKTNQECVQWGICTNISEAVCDLPSGDCHCHDHGEIPCSDNQSCVMECSKPGACCHNDHHCHCDEPCGIQYTTPASAATTYQRP